MEETDFSKNFFSAILFTLIAGLSTGIGGLLVIGYGKPTFTKLGHMLSFSAGVMIFISFMDLMPEAVQHVGYVTANAWMFGGMALFAAVAQFVPEPDVSGLISDEEVKKQAGDKKKKDDEPAKAKKSDDKEKDNKKTEKPKGDEEKKKPKEEVGHGHSHGGPAITQKDTAQERKYLMSIGIITALGISLHNFPEGIAVYLACLRGLEVGLPLTFAIAAHNIPEGMAVASPIYHSTGSKWLAFKYSLLSGICEPIGALVVGALFHSFLTDYIVHCMLAAVAGIMILISIKELIPTTLRYIPAESAAISNVLGMLVVMAGVHWLHGSLAEFHGHGHGGADHGHSHGGHSHSGGIHEEVALRLDETGVAWELPPTPRPGSHHGHSHGGGDHGHSHGGHGHSHGGHGHSHGGHGHSHGGHGHSHEGHGHSHF